MARKKLRLYVWTDVLTDWTAGLAVAYAYSPEEAKAILMKDGIGEWNWDGLKLSGQDFQVVEEPSGFWVYGGS